MPFENFCYNYFKVSIAYTVIPAILKGHLDVPYALLVRSIRIYKEHTTSNVALPAQVEGSDK